VLEAADRGVRDRLARSGGEAPAHDLVAYIEEQFGEHTGERRTVRKALEKLIVHVSYASRGRFTPFDESIDPELFAEEMTSMHEGERFRAQFLLDKIEQILPLLPLLLLLRLPLQTLTCRPHWTACERHWQRSRTASCSCSRAPLSSRQSPRACDQLHSWQRR